MLLAGILMMHGFSWHLGLQYRDHYEAFGWAFQRHERKTPEIHPPRTMRGFAVQPGTKPPEPR